MSELRAMLEKQWQSRTIMRMHKPASWVLPVWMQTASPGRHNGLYGGVLPDPPRAILRAEPPEQPATDDSEGAR